MDLLETFARLPRPATAGAYSVVDIGSNCRIGKSFEGHPAILISLPERDGAHLQRRLANFAYLPPHQVRLRSGANLGIAEARGPRVLRE